MKLQNRFILIFVIFFSIALFGCKENNTTQPTTNNNTGTANSPVLANPPNNATIQQLTPQLEWQSFSTATSYRVQASLDANFAGTMIIDTSGITATQLTLQNQLIVTGIYFYWRVIATVPAGASDWSSTWRFRVISAPPSVPNLLLPQNGSQDQSFLPFFDWDDSPTAQTYRIQVSTVSNFQTHILDSAVITSQLQCPHFLLNTASQYYWRVNATNSNGLSTSAWSPTFSFTTVAGPTPSSISGVITFVDTNFTQPSEGRYVIGAYTVWPPIDNGPDFLQVLAIQKNGNTASANYIFNNMPDGQYKLAVFYEATPNLINEPILGIYGCDTVHIKVSDCPNNPATLNIVNGNGLDSRNILSWADTFFRIF